MKIVYFLQTHKNLPQIRRLVHRIKGERPAARIVISQNEAQFRIGPEVFAGLSDVHVTHATGVARASFSLVRPFLHAVDELLAQGVEFDWIVKLSGQCYPARSLALFEAQLARDDCDGYLRYFHAFTPSPENPWDMREARHRYLYHYWRLSRGELPSLARKLLSAPRRLLNNVQPFVRLDTSFGLHVGRRARPPIFDERFRCYGGRYFMALSGRTAAYLARFTRERPEIVAYFARTLLSDESYIQTVLVNNPELRLRDQDLFYIDWRGGRLGSPRTLGTADYQEIVASGAYFARKFDASQDARILDLLDERAIAERPTLAPGASQCAPSHYESA